MKQYIDAFNTYLENKGLHFDDADVETLLDALFCCFQQSNGLDSATIRGYFGSLDHILDELSLEKNDRVFDLVCKLCSECQRIAFEEGVTVGFRLYNELHK